MRRNYKKYILQIKIYMIAQDFWQAHYQIMLIIFLKGFIELNANMDTVIKNVKPSKLHIRIGTVFLNTKALRMI